MPLYLYIGVFIICDVIHSFLSEVKNISPAKVLAMHLLIPFSRFFYEKISIAIIFSSYYLYSWYSFQGTFD